MKRYKKLLMIGSTVMMIGTGCSNESHIEKENRVQRELNQKPQKKTALDKKVEKSFEEHLKIYPVKSLDDFYDMEGFRDEEFDKYDKGTWVLNSGFVKKKDKDSPLTTNDVFLFINRNSGKATGSYVINEIYSDKKKNKKKEYKITIKDKKLRLIEDAPEDVKNEINRFEFLVESESFGELRKYKKIKSRHNEELPLYTIDYLLSEENNLNQWVQNQYKLKSKNAILYVEKSGAIEGSSLGDFEFKIEYPLESNGIQYFYESIIFQPSNEVT
ncbi:Csa1 family protein [Macrococcoides canis]|uniref:Csa1 family protein n=1 Tax=Macrococcoides canis TaxID=1855823 RepID=UPI0020B7C005|nr:Csa1 family protein [Macrococcus canis]UTH01859.1 Csa1 family protein [Macrococcus canis]